MQLQQGKKHPEMMGQSSFTDPHVIPKMYDL